MTSVCWVHGMPMACRVYIYIQSERMWVQALAWAPMNVRSNLILCLPLCLRWGLRSCHCVTRLAGQPASRDPVSTSHLAVGCRDCTKWHKSDFVWILKTLTY